jgi:hypothetical protein
VFTSWVCNEESSLCTFGKAYCFHTLAGRYCRYSSAEREVEIDSPSPLHMRSRVSPLLPFQLPKFREETTNSHVNSGFTVRHHPLQSC